MSAGRAHKKPVPKGRDAHGNPVPLSVTRTDDGQADPDNTAQRRGKREVGTMAKAPSSSKPSPSKTTKH